jgi:hypothetical protein
VLTGEENKNRDRRKDHWIYMKIAVSAARWGRNQKASLDVDGNGLVEMEHLI